DCSKMMPAFVVLIAVKYFSNSNRQSFASPLYMLYDVSHLNQRSLVRNLACCSLDYPVWNTNADPFCDNYKFHSNIIVSQLSLLLQNWDAHMYKRHHH
ncbi:hypothetical protein ACJX0J_019655, partial [Zea mays]